MGITRVDPEFLCDTNGLPLIIGYAHVTPSLHLDL